MTKICPVCGKSFEPQGHNQKYCSPKCQRDSQTEANYQAIRKRNAIQGKVRYNHNLYYAFDFKCAICGWRLPDKEVHKHGCQMHHIKAVSDGGTNDESNLVLLCPNCHKMAHAGFLSDEELAKHTFTKEQAQEASHKACLETQTKVLQSMADLFR